MMKTILFFLLLVTSPLIHSQNQNLSNGEPKNNLGYTLEQLKEKFPDLKYWSTRNGGVEYKDGDNVLFQLVANKVVLEYMGVEGEGNFSHDWYQATVQSFKKTNYKTIYDGGRFYEFEYSNFKVVILYSSNSKYASISYEPLRINQ
jgi:hypothetical protein